MGSFYSPPAPPATGLLSSVDAMLRRQGQAVGLRLRSMSSEHRWAVGGLILAQVMVVFLYLILVDNITQVEKKRAAVEQQSQQRHRCAMLSERLERDQCMASLAPPEENTVFLATR